jgi:hypothetical protein
MARPSVGTGNRVFHFQKALPESTQRYADSNPAKRVFYLGKLRFPDKLVIINSLLNGLKNKGLETCIYHSRNPRFGPPDYWHNSLIGI